MACPTIQQITDNLLELQFLNSLPKDIINITASYARSFEGQFVGDLMTLDYEPTEIAVNDGELFVVDKGYDKLHVYKIDTCTEVRQLKLMSGSIWDLLVYDNYVVTAGNYGVVIMDKNTGKTVCRPSEKFCSCISINGGKLYMSERRSCFIDVYDLIIKEHVDTIYFTGGDDFPILFHKDGIIVPHDFSTENEETENLNLYRLPAIARGVAICDDKIVVSYMCGGFTVFSYKNKAENTEPCKGISFDKGKLYVAGKNNIKIYD